jgi:homoserine acetyltransferase
MMSEGIGLTGSGRIEQRQSVLRLRNFEFEGGPSVGELRVAYWTVGHLSSSRDNVVFLCHGASGHRDWALPSGRVGRQLGAARAGRALLRGG